MCDNLAVAAGAKFVIGQLPTQLLVVVDLSIHLISTIFSIKLNLAFNKINVDCFRIWKKKKGKEINK